MDIKTCGICGERVNRRFARYCDACRPSTRGKPAMHVWTAERDQVLRDRYDGKVQYRAAAIAAELGVPTWAVKKRAAVLGLTQPVERKDWTNQETRFLREHVGRRTVDWIAKQLHRSVTSVVLKSKRLKISRAFTDGYTMRRLEACFGCDHKIIQGWIREGKLKATRRATDRPLDAWYTTDVDVLRFILDHPLDFRLDKVDQPWFMSLITGAVNGTSTQRPAPPSRPAMVQSKKTYRAVAPPGVRCALCDAPIRGDAVCERRPSGVGEQMQTWWYCEECKAA